MISRVCSGTKGQPCQAAWDIATNAYRRSVRGTTAARGYGSPWQAISRKRRRLFPFCELNLPGCTRVSTETDHRIPVRAGGRSVWSNAQAACHACNNAKRAADLERWPIDRYPEGVTR